MEVAATEAVAMEVTVVDMVGEEIVVTVVDMEVVTAGMEATVVEETVDTEVATVVDTNLGMLTVYKGVQRYLYV